MRAKDIRVSFHSERESRTKASTAAMGARTGGSVEDGEDSGGETVSFPETALLQKGGGTGTGLPDAEEQLAFGRHCFGAGLRFLSAPGGRARDERRAKLPKITLTLIESGAERKPAPACARGERECEMKAQWMVVCTASTSVYSSDLCNSQVVPVQ